jgi:MFS family permease
MSRRPGTFTALAEPRYRLLWIGSLLSFLAVQMQLIARGWLAFSLTGNNKGLGLVYLGFGVPMLLLTPWGGVAADRLPKRHVLMAAQLVLAISSGAVALAISLDAMRYWMLVASSVVQSVGFSFNGPVRMAFTGELVGRERLPNAIVLQQLSLNGSRILGPSIAGAMIGVRFFGVGAVYWATTVLIFAAMGVSLQLPLGRPAADRIQRSPLAELSDGLRYVRARPMLLMLVATSFVVVMSGFPYVAFLPTLADRVYHVGASGYGTMSAVTAVGAVIAALFIAARASGGSAIGTQVGAGLLFGTGVALLPFAPTYAVALAVVFCVGGASSVFQALNNSLVLGNTDFDYHGRVQSLLMLSFSGFGMAALPLGAMADAIGLHITMVVMGGCAAIAVAVYAMGRPSVARRHRELEDGRVAAVALAEGVQA